MIHWLGSRRIRSLAVLSVLTLLFTSPSFPQTKKRATQKNAAPIWPKTDCSQNVELRLNAANSMQGSLLQAELRSPTPLSDVSGTWDEKTIPFWQETPSATKATAKAPATSKSKSAPQDIHRALLGIDLEKPAGTYEFTVNAKTADAVTITCKATITVKAGKFATDVIAPLNTVGDKFGTPFKDGTITMPPGWKQAYKAWSQAGWNGLAAPVTDSVVNGYRVAMTPDRLLGRVESVRTNISLLIAPLGPLAAGTLLASVSAAATVGVFAVVGLVLALWGTLSPSIRDAPSLDELDGLAAAGGLP